MQYLIEPAKRDGGPACYIEAQTPEEAMAKAFSENGDPDSPYERESCGPFFAHELREDAGEAWPENEFDTLAARGWVR